MKRIILKVYGKVQGVFFRDSSEEKARELNLTGWAKNEPDGTVKIVIEGREEDLKKFIDWCQEGSQGSKVEKVEIEHKEATGEFNNFEIRY